MFNTMSLIFIIGMVIIAINLSYQKHQQLKKKHEPLKLRAVSGDFRGQTHDIKDWRKIAIELAKTTKNSRLSAMAKYGTDDDIIGLLYLNFGVELIDETD